MPRGNHGHARSRAVELWSPNFVVVVVVVASVSVSVVVVVVAGVSGVVVVVVVVAVAVVVWVLLKGRVSYAPLVADWRISTKQRLRPQDSILNLLRAAAGAFLPSFLPSFLSFDAGVCCPAVFETDWATEACALYTVGSLHSSLQQ